jgi:transposase
MCDQAADKPGLKGGDTATGAPALVTTPARAAAASKERIYVGLDIGYREHVAAASPLSAFNVRRNPDGWKRVKPIHFASDAAGFGRFQRYLDRYSPDPRDFLILLEPTGSYGLTVLLFLLGKGYRVLQVDNRAVKDYREKIFGSETKTDDTDARLMARMGFLHELVGEEFSIQPVLLMNPDAAALRAMVHDLAKLQKEITRRRNQLQQMAALTFPELKTFFKGSTAAPAARALLEHFATPQDLAAAPTEHVTEVLRSVHAYGHALRAAELQALAKQTAGVPTLTHHQWRQAWLIKQLSVLEGARKELVDEVALATANHPYTRIIESLPVKSPIWTATLIGAIGDIDRFSNIGKFKAYLGWSPQLTRSGSSVNESELAKTGVRPARNVLGQMTVIMLSSTIRATPFRNVYQRLTGRGMRPASALGHVAGKLSVVLYGMLKNMTPYDEDKHRKQLGIVEGTYQASSTPVDVSLEPVDLTDSPVELASDEPSLDDQFQVQL